MKDLPTTIAEEIIKAKYKERFSHFHFFQKMFNTYPRRSQNK